MEGLQYQKRENDSVFHRKQSRDKIILANYIKDSPLDSSLRPRCLFPNVEMLSRTDVLCQVVNSQVQNSAFAVNPPKLVVHWSFDGIYDNAKLIVVAKRLVRWNL